MIASSPQPGIRFCASCLAIYRQEFMRCPLDGASLVVGANDPWIGLTVGNRYVIEALIGEGAMGRVYRAHHHQFRDRRYAIKILLGDLAATPQMRARFELEAAHASKLSHPNVVGVIDFGTTPNNVNYMVMELVEGPTLGALLRGAPMEAERVITLARQICEGLDHAHGRGMIHRDLKPDNILVLRERDQEIARIADFGLALSKDDEARLTTTGVVCTPAYASPEQLRGESMDHRVDLYALGTTMYEMLSGGTLPFNGDVDATVTNKLTSEAPSILLVAPNVPPALVAIVGRLLSPQPDRRPRSARAVIRALDQALSAPRVAMKTDQTARLRASAPQIASENGDAKAYAALQVEMPTRQNRVRRTAMQLLACGLTLSGVLAWVDMHGTTVRAEPALVAMAEPASTTAATSIETVADVDMTALRSAAAHLGAPVTVDGGGAAEAVTASFKVPSFSLAFSGRVAVPTQLVLAPERSVADPTSRVMPATSSPTVIERKPAAGRVNRERVQRRPAVRRPRRAEAEPAAEPMPEMPGSGDDVVEQILNSGSMPAADEHTVEVPGVTPTPAVATPPAPEAPPSEAAADEVVLP